LRPVTAEVAKVTGSVERQAPFGTTTTSSLPAIET
jgi:hypothetical protein